MIQAKRIGHATFETPDIERQIDYYQDLVGLRLAARDAGRAFLVTPVGQLAVVLEKGGQQRCTALSFEVSPGLETADMARALAGLDVASETRRDALPGVSRQLRFHDPKGTAIELFSEWSFLGAEAPVGGAGPLKLGHVAFAVPDPQAIAEFYGKTLGFRVSDWIEDFFVFMRCGFDHHTINFIRGDTGLHHIAFELRDAHHVHHACDLLGRRGTDILWGPVRHGPGHNVAVYHRNPDDQVVELFIEMDRMLDEELGYFDPRPWHRDRPQKPKVWTGMPRDIWGLPPAPDFRRGSKPAGGGG
jgi:catechol 2,3-dioxygenase-like lactoylglutathione lyase family enzyme